MNLVSIESFFDGVIIEIRYMNADTGGLLPFDYIPTNEDVIDTKEPNWDNLKNRLLGGDLYPLFQRLTIAAMQSNEVSTAQAHISMAILNVRIESALIAGLNLLTQFAGYPFTQEEKDLWNTATTEEGFSDSIFI